MAKSEAGSRKSRRMGRPPAPIESIRRKRVVTLLTDAESEKLAKIAEEKDMSVSTMVRQIVSDFLKRLP